MDCGRSGPARRPDGGLRRLCRFPKRARRGGAGPLGPGGHEVREGRRAQPEQRRLPGGARARQDPGVRVPLREGQDVPRLGPPRARGRRARADRSPRRHQRLRPGRAAQGARGDGQAGGRPQRRLPDGEDQEEGPRLAGGHAAARALERPAHQPELPPAQADQADLPGPRRCRRHQHHLRPAAQGRQCLDRPDQHRVPEGAGDADPPGEPLLQDHRRAHNPDRRRHAREPQDLRGPGHPDLLPLERRRDRGRELAARAAPDHPHLRQQGRELDHSAGHRRQGLGGGAHRRTE